MKRRRNRILCTRNNRWYEGYKQGGYFCLPRTLLFSMVDYIDNATLYVYLALASCHYEDNTTYAGPHIAKLTGKDERAVRGHLADLETLGLIKREQLGQGYKILFQCPARARVKEGAEAITKRKLAIVERRRKVKTPTEPKLPSEVHAKIPTDSVDNYGLDLDDGEWPE